MQLGEQSTNGQRHSTLIVVDLLDCRGNPKTHKAAQADIIHGALKPFPMCGINRRNPDGLDIRLPAHRAVRDSVIDLEELALRATKREENDAIRARDANNRTAITQLVFNIVVPLLNRILKIVEVIGHRVACQILVAVVVDAPSAARIASSEISVTPAAVTVRASGRTLPAPAVALSRSAAISRR